MTVIDLSARRKDSIETTRRLSKINVGLQLGMTPSEIRDTEVKREIGIIHQSMRRIRDYIGVNEMIEKVERELDSFGRRK